MDKRGGFPASTRSGSLTVTPERMADRRHTDIRCSNPAEGVFVEAESAAVCGSLNEVGGPLKSEPTERWHEAQHRFS